MINFWNCELCKTYNDILTLCCKSCQFHIPDWITSEYLFRIEIRRAIWFERINMSYEITKFEKDPSGKCGNKRCHSYAEGIDGYCSPKCSYEGSVARTMTKEEELFRKFYAEEEILVKDMDDIQLREHRDKLREIAFEAKARAVSADDKVRERNAKKTNKEWLLTPTQPDLASSDAINAVKLRQARMSKMDKLRADLLKTLDEETVNDMMKNLESKATEKQVKTITFQKPTVEISAVTVKTVKPTGDGVKPFDPSSLSFKKKS